MAPYDVSMFAILSFFMIHWMLAVFCQTFFLHRYSAHRMFSMSKGWERFFYTLTWLAQGSSFLSPRAYAILHREHHAFSDTARDPHSPHIYKNFFDMMWQTKRRYNAILHQQIETEPRFEGGYPYSPVLEYLAESWTSRIAFGAGYTLFYLAFAPHWAFFLLLPAHYLMGPIHGAIVNWGGHMYGYRNFNVDDESRNTLIFDFLTLGELFQNNHHKWGASPKFAVRWFEVDPTYLAIRTLDALGIIKIKKTQKPHWSPDDLLPKAGNQITPDAKQIPGVAGFSDIAAAS